MSLYACDVNGYVGDVTSVGGWWNVIVAVDNLRDPILRSLVNKGYCKDLSGLIRALERWGKWKLSPDINKIRLNLVKLARKAEGVLIITENVGIDDEIKHPKTGRGKRVGRQSRKAGGVTKARRIRTQKRK